MSIALCPSNLPDLEVTLRRVADDWATASLRPRVSPAVCAAWERLIEEWIQNRDVPLFIRKPQNNRGARLNHSSGRILVPADNGPAHWAMSLAFEGRCPTLEQVRQLIADGAIPVAMALKRAERELCSFKPGLHSTTINKAGWKVCHIRQVKLGVRLPLESVPMTQLEDHFRRFLSPGNMFVVPLKYACLGELPEMVLAISAADRSLD